MTIEGRTVVVLEPLGQGTAGVRVRAATTSEVARLR